MLTWLEKQGIKYIIGIPGNSILRSKADSDELKTKSQFQESLLKQKIFSEVLYKAKTWSHERRVPIKAEYSERGENARLVITNLEGTAQNLFEKIYCARGEMENRIKEQQLFLFADRTSCHKCWLYSKQLPTIDQFRLLLSSLALV